MNLKNLWFLAFRYIRSKRRERGLTAPLLSLLGLAVGVLTLNSVLAVMNGFQLTFIESILEVSSSHLRWETERPVSPEMIEKVRRIQGVRSIIPMYETQTMVQGVFGTQRGAILRGIPVDALQKDSGLAAHLTFVQGRLFHQEHGEIVLGSELSRVLGVGVGDKIRLLALTGPNFSLLAPKQVELQVVGLFETGYYELDSGSALISLSDAADSFAGKHDFHYAIKLEDGNQDGELRSRIAQTLNLDPQEIISWREYNAAFFGALRTEKNAMMVLIGLIFLVVGVNIFYALRRTVQEHREDIALLQAVGTEPRWIRAIFAAEGAGIGFIGAMLGTVLGVLVSSFIPSILGGLETGLNAVLSLFRQQGIALFSTEAFYLPRIPARLLPEEVVFIGLFAALSATGAAWLASRQVSKIPCAEVLKNE